jgi:hypothetical protein
MTMEELIMHSIETYRYTQAEVDLYAAAIEEKKQAIEKVKQQALCLYSAEVAEHLARHGMQPNQLFEENLETPTKEATAKVLDLSGNSPDKKKIKSMAGVLWTVTSNRYTTKGFSLTLTAHPYSHPLTYVEATICLTLEDKPKEFINAIKLLLQNTKFLDPNFGLAPLKNTTGKPIRIITTEDNVPSNFTHLDQYAFTSGNRIFEKKKNWKRDKKNKPHHDDAAKEFADPVVYFTIAIATNQLRVIIDGIRMEWETHGGGKLQVKDLQSHESKVVFLLYYVYAGMPFHIIKKTLEAILRKAADMLIFQEIAPNEKYNHPNLPQILIHPQVLRLKGVDTSGYDKLPYHVRENCKALHIESKPEYKKELKELFQYAKE